MVFHCTFLISNLTPEPNLVFTNLSILSGVTFRVFLSYFVFHFKKIRQKWRLRYLKKFVFHKQKMSLAIEWERMWKYGITNSYKVFILSFLFNLLFSLLHLFQWKWTFLKAKCRLTLFHLNSNISNETKLVFSKSI